MLRKSPLALPATVASAGRRPENRELLKTFRYFGPLLDGSPICLDSHCAADTPPSGPATDGERLLVLASRSRRHAQESQPDPASLGGGGRGGGACPPCVPRRHQQGETTDLGLSAYLNEIA